MSGAVFLEPEAMAQVAAELQGAARTVSSGGVCVGVGLPGADGGLGAAIMDLFRVEGEATAVAATQAETLARHLEQVVQTTRQADRFAPR